MAYDTPDQAAGTGTRSIYSRESSGFCKEGEALDVIRDGRIELDGELPLNTFGGSLKEPY